MLRSTVLPDESSDLRQRLATSESQQNLKIIPVSLLF
jgi:hypothetical protein